MEFDYDLGTRIGTGATLWVEATPLQAAPSERTPELAERYREVVAFLNADGYYLPGAVTAAVHGFEAHPEAAAEEHDLQSNTSSRGMGTTNLAPQSRAWASWFAISLRRFQGRMKT